MTRKKDRLSLARLGHCFSRFNFRRADECVAALRWLNPVAGECILDVGCGDGYYDWHISRLGARVTGIDVHEKRLASARRRYGDERTEFLYMDAERADFPAGSFDKALSLCVMEHLRNDELVMRNVSRAMKPGGCFVFSADSLSNPEITSGERGRHRRRYAVKTLYTEDLVRGKLSRAGFDIEETCYVLSTPMALKLVRLSWQLDDLPSALIPLRFLGYIVLNAAYKAISAFRGGALESTTAGLTLIVQARKRAE